MGGGYVQVKKRAPQINSFRRDWICAQNLLTILESIIKMIQGGGGLMWSSYSSLSLILLNNYNLRLALELDEIDPSCFIYNYKHT